MQICVGLTGRPRDTGAQVGAVGRLRERAPVVGKVLELFADLVDAGERALAIGDVDGLGRLLDVAHGLLCALRVSSPEIETLVHGARAAGAVGAKLTGAGGGGAVIALAPGHEHDVHRALAARRLRRFHHHAWWRADRHRRSHGRSFDFGAAGARRTGGGAMTRSHGARGAYTAQAGTNIALVKYWGKRDAALNLPATGSLSLTLAELGTRTTVRFLDGSDHADADGDGDRVTLNGAPADARVRARVSAFLDRVRARAGITQRAEVVSENSVPTAAGLASSASGFAALALAASRAAGLELASAELSELARLGSGSAARSIFGGFVEMARGERADGRDAVAAPVDGGDAASEASADVPWDVRLVVAITAAGEKAEGSTSAMDRTARTSPFYPAWVASAPGDLVEARAAIAARDLARLGTVAERSALRMHATALAADPPILYWNAATVAAIHATRGLRARGVAAYFTIDAGPHVKVLCAAADAAAVGAAMADVPGVLRTITASPGPGARLVDARGAEARSAAATPAAASARSAS